MSPSPTPVMNAWSWTEPATDIAQIVAIIVGGLWAYLLFVKKRERWPRASLAHTITHWSLDDGRRVLRVAEKIANTGGVLLRIGDRRTWVQQILPMEPEPLRSLEEGKVAEAPWLTLGHPHENKAGPDAPELEPGEHEHFEHDFLIDDEAQVVQVYSHFHNPSRRRSWWGGSKADERGWTLTTVHDLQIKAVTKTDTEED